MIKGVKSYIDQDDYIQQRIDADHSITTNFLPNPPAGESSSIQKQYRSQYSGSTQLPHMSAQKNMQS